jgi:hypothetical protein
VQVQVLGSVVAAVRRPAPVQQQERERALALAQRQEAASWPAAVQAQPRVGEAVGPEEKLLPKGSARPPREPPSKAPPGQGNPKASAYPDKP